MLTTVTTKGQVVIPAKVRRKLRLIEGTKLAVDVREGEIVLRPLSSDPIEEACGCLAGEDSLVEALLEMRREDLAREEDRAR
jgi:AbrB family looped-hinge helix DNA binding protein